MIDTPTLVGLGRVFVSHFLEQLRPTVLLCWDYNGRFCCRYRIPRVGSACEAGEKERKTSRHRL